MEKKLNATEIFFEKISPFFAAHGFKLLKSKRKFVKTTGDLAYEVFIKFDGRGGLTVLDWVDVYVKKGTDVQLVKNYRNLYFEGEKMKMLFPVMYSRQALNFANEMNLKALGRMLFEEKYPPDRINASVERFIEFAQKEIFILF